jgi:hypothetical protein
MKTKNKYLTGISLLIAILAVFLSMNVVSAADAVATFRTPAASATIGENATLNITIANVPLMGNFTCRVYASSTLTGNSSWTLLAELNNNTLGVGTNVGVNGTFNSIILEDANNYIFNASCFNNSHWWTQDTNTGVVVDNTVPVAATGLTPTTDTDGVVSFSSTVTGSRTTSCTLRFPGINPGSSSYTMTHSGSTCTYTSLTMPEQTYTYYVRASDESNTTDSAVQTLNVDVKTGGGEAAAILAEGEYTTNDGGTVTISQDGEDSGNSKTIGIIVFMSIIGVIGYLIFRK